MRKLVFLFAIFFSLAGMASLSLAQDQEVDGEALLEQFLPEGVTLETASEEQITTAMEGAIGSNTGSQAAISAITQAATSSPRVMNTVSAATAITSTFRQLGNTVFDNTYLAGVLGVQQPSSIVEPELAADVITNIIRNSNLTLNQVNQLVNNTVSRASSLALFDSFAQDQSEFITAIANRIRTSAAQAISEQRNEVCTVSNGTTTCVPA